MYCKKCLKEYPKNKKTCKDCGIALTPGHPKSTNENSRRRTLIIAGLLVVAIIAVFLIIGIQSLNYQAIKGSWYDTGSKIGSIVFNESGTAKWIQNGAQTDCQYVFDGYKGTITRNGEKHDFTCDGGTLTIDGVKLLKSSETT